MPQATVNPQKYLVLGVKNGLGYNGLENTCIRISPIFSKQRLLSLFSYGDVFTYDFSWTLADNCLNRLRSSGAMIRIEVWAKRSGRHFIIGYAVIGVKKAQFANQDDKLFSHRLRLQSGVKNLAVVIDTEILVTLNIQNTPPASTYDEICQETNLQWLKYCSEAEVDYLSDPSEDSPRNDKLKNKKSRNRKVFDENGEIWKTTESPIGSVWKNSSESSSSSDNGMGLKSKDIPSIFSLLHSENPELLPYSEKNKDKNQEPSNFYTDFGCDVDVPKDLEISPYTQVRRKAEVYNPQKLNAEMRKIGPKKPPNDPFMRAEQLILKTSKLASARDKKKGKMMLKRTPATYKAAGKQPELNKNENEDSCDVSSNGSSINLLLESKPNSEHWWIKNTKENAKKKMCPETYNDISPKSTSSPKLSAASIINSEENSHNENNNEVVSLEKSDIASVNKKETVPAPVSFTISCDDFGSKNKGQTTKEKNFVSGDESKTVPPKSFTINFTNSEECCSNKNNVEETHIAPLDKRPMSNKSSFAGLTNSKENQNYKDNFQNISLEKTAAASVDKKKTVSGKRFSMYTTHLEINQENKNNNHTAAFSNTDSKPTFQICNIKPAVQFEEPPVCTLLDSVPEKAVLYSEPYKDDEFKIETFEQGYHIAESLAMLLQSYREKQQVNCGPQTTLVNSETHDGVEYANCPNKTAATYSETHKDDEYATYPVKAGVMHSEAYTDVDNINYPPKTSTVHSEIYKDVNNVNFPSKTTSVYLETHKDNEYPNCLSENHVMYSEAWKDNDNLNLIPETTVMHRKTHKNDNYTNYSLKNATVYSETDEAAGNGNYMSIRNQVGTINTAFDVKTSNKNLTLENCQNCYKMSNRNMSNTSDEENREMLHCYLLNMHIKSIKWYSKFKDLRVSVRFFNPTDENVVTALEGERLSSLDKLLSYVICHFYYVCTPACLLKTVNTYPPSVLICKMYKNAIAKGHLTIKYSKAKSRTQYFHGYLPLFSKDKENVAALFVKITFEDLGLTRSDKIDHLHTECILKFIHTVKDTRHSVVTDLNKLSQSTKGCQNIIYKHVTNCFSSNENSKQMEDFENQSVSSTNTEMLETIFDKSDNNETSSTNYKITNTTDKSVASSDISSHTSYSSAEVFCNEEYKTRSTSSAIKEEKAHSESEEFEKMTQNSSSHSKLTEEFGTEQSVNKDDENDKLFSDQELTEYLNKWSQLTNDCSYSDDSVIKYIENQHEMIFNKQYVYDEDTFNKGTDNENDKQMQEFENQSVSSNNTEMLETVFDKSDNNETSSTNYELTNITDTKIPEDQCDLECLNINDEVVPDQTDNPKCDLTENNPHSRKIQDDFDNEHIAKTKTNNLNTYPEENLFLPEIPEENPKCDLTVQNPHFHKIQDGFDKQYIAKTKTNILNTYPEEQNQFLLEIPEEQCNLECLNINDEVVPDQTDNPKCDVTKQNPHSLKIQDGFDKQHIAKTKTHILNTYPVEQNLFLPEIPENKCDLECLNIYDEVLPDQTDNTKCDLTEQNPQSHKIQDDFDKQNIAKTRMKYLKTYREQNLFLPVIPEEECDLICDNINDEVVNDQIDNPKSELTEQNPHSPKIQDGFDKQHIAETKTNILNSYPEDRNLFLEIPEDKCDLVCHNINDEVVPDQTDNPKCDLTQQNPHSPKIQDGFDKQHIAKTKTNINTYPKEQNLFLPEILEDKCDLEYLNVNDEVVPAQTDIPKSDLTEQNPHSPKIQDGFDKQRIAETKTNILNSYPEEQNLFLPEIPEDKCDLECLNINDEVVPDQTDDIQILEIRTRMKDISAALDKCYGEYDKLKGARCETWDTPNVKGSLSAVDSLLSEWSRLETELRFLEADF